jgi:hypothetical protein
MAFKPVMAGLDPAIHVFNAIKRVPENGSYTQSIVIASFTAKGEHADSSWSRRGVDGRDEPDEPGHDDLGPRRSRKKGGQQLSL